MDKLLLHIIHGFEGFRRDAVKARCFSLLEFGDGMFDLSEGDWGVNVGKAWLLGNEFKDGVINWSVVIEDFVEVHAEDWHVFFCIGGKVTNSKLHGHVDVGFVVWGFTTSKQVDILPCEAWVELHVVYVGAYAAVPACFGQVDEITITLVDLFVFELEASNFIGGEVDCVL